MRQDFKGYVLIDSHNRIVPGSLILRKPNQRPPMRYHGRWLEIEPYTCCVPGGSGTPVTLAVPTLTAPNSYTVEVSSGGILERADTGLTDINDLNDYMNDHYSDVGSFAVSGTSIIFTPSVDGATITFSQAVDGEEIDLPTLDGGNPNYHIELVNGSLTTGDVDTGTTTPAALQSYLTTNYSLDGTYTLNGTTSIVFKATSVGTELTITAGA